MDKAVLTSSLSLSGTAFPEIPVQVFLFVDIVPSNCDCDVLFSLLLLRSGGGEGEPERDCECEEQRGETAGQEAHAGGADVPHAAPGLQEQPGRVLMESLL